MKLHKYIVMCLPVFLALAAVSCDKDGDMITTSGPTGTTLESNTGDIVLSVDHLHDLALTLYWDENGEITLSDPRVEAPDDAVSNTLQFSTSADFSNVYEDNIEGGTLFRQYTHQALNNIMARLGVEGGTTVQLYVRMKSSIGSNVAATYSEAKVFNVTTYLIDMSVAKYLTKDREETGRILASPNSDGVYRGFIGAGAWENWWLQEGDNTYWGNLGVDGMSFYASSASDSWNFWYPAPSGCYYTTVNTKEGWWSALYVESLSISGDISGEMTYNRTANQWSINVSNAAAATVSITISGKGQLYNTDTTADGPGIEQTVGFGGAADMLTFGSTAQSISVSLPAGETALIIDLNDPNHWTVGSGTAVEEPTVAPRLYFSGLVTWDGIEQYLTLTDTDAQTYGGAHFIDSEWGYRAYPSTEWSPAYRGGDGSTGLAGTLVYTEADNDGNIPAPEKGVYIMNFDLKNLTYALTEVQSVAFCGVNDDWSLRDMTQSADNPEIYTLDFEKTGDTPWGTKVIINGDWSLFFGGGDIEGTLYLRTDSSAQGFTGDNALEVGKTYTLTVDLGAQTYTYTEK